MAKPLPIVFCTAIILLLSGCFGLDELKDTTKETKEEVSKTNAQVKKTNEQMEEVRQEIRNTNDQVATLIYRQSKVGLLAIIKEEGMSNIGIAAAQRYLTLLKPEELRKNLATVRPDSDPWIKEGFANVSVVGDAKLGKHLDHDLMSYHFYEVYQRAVVISVKELLAFAKNPASKQLSEKMPVVLRILRIAPTLLGAIELKVADIDGNKEIVVEEMKNNQSREKIKTLLLELADRYLVPSEIEDELEGAISAKLGSTRGAVRLKDILK